MNTIKQIWERWAAWWEDDDALTTEQQEQLGAFHRWMYDSIFAVAGGSSCDPETGYVLATKYGKWILRRRDMGSDE